MRLKRLVSFILVAFSLSGADVAGAVTWTAENLISSGDYRDIAVGDLNKDGRNDVVAAKNGGVSIKHQGKTWVYGANEWRYSFGSYVSSPFPDRDLDLIPDSNDSVKNTGTGVIAWPRSIPPSVSSSISKAEKWEITCTGVVGGVATFSVAAKSLNDDGLGWTTRLSDSFSTQLTRNVEYSATAFETYSSTFKKSGSFTYTYTGSYSDSTSGVSFIVSTLSTSDSRYVNFAAGDSFLFVTIPGTVTLTSGLGNNFNGIQLADINKNGNLDILAVSNTGLAVWLGNGIGGWDKEYDANLTGSGGTKIRTGDFNRDGKLDIAISTSLGIKVYIGNDTGVTWTPYDTDLPTSGTYNNLAVGDYNNDGLPDIIAAKTTQLEVYKNNGDGTWASAINVGAALTGGRTYKTVAVADLDGDGKLDVAAGISAGSGEAAGITVYYGDGAGSWTAATSNPTGFDNYNGSTIADLNNDGSLDIAGAQDGGGIQVWFGDRATRTWVAQTSPTVVGGYKAITAGDISNNGILSLISAKNGGVDVISQVNAPYFNSWSTGPTAGGSYQRVAVADIDKDGSLDIVATDNAVGAAVGGVHVFYGDGSTRVFGQGVKYPGTTDPTSSGTHYALALGDMNRDGYADIVATSNGIPGGISIWNYQPGTDSWAAGTTTGLPLTGNYYGMKLADLNSDGYLDIVSGSDSGVKVYVWNNGTTQYDGKSPADTGSYFDVTVTDFNKDGKYDIAAAGSGGISIWLGDGSGDFSAVSNTNLTQYTGVLGGSCWIGVSGGAPYAGIAAGDIDGDGNPDIVAGNNNNCGVQAWFNDGSGIRWRIGYATEPGPSISNSGIGGIGFGYPQSDPTHSNVWNIGTGATTFTADWTLTGEFDMEVAPLFAFLADADGQAQVSRARVGSPYTSDGGGVQDLTLVPWAPQSSSTTFHPADPLDTAPDDVFYFKTSAPGVWFSGSYYGVELADVNHDGYLDVVAASNGSGVGVWFGNGKGEWTAQSSPISYGDYNGIAVADFNGDGYLDIVAGHHISGGVGLEVFLNDIDLVPPMVSATSPASGATNIPTSDSVTVTFSEPMDGTTLNSSNITVTGSASGSRTVSLFYDSSTMTLTIDPTLDFFPKETITVTLTTGVTDAFGNRLDGNGNGYEDGSPTDDYTFTFQTKDTAPTNLNATAGDGQVALNWDRNTESDLKGYFVYRATSSGGPYTRITATPITTVTYTDSTVTNDTTYYYVVTALDEISGYPTDAYAGSGNGNYESGYSNEVSAKPTVSKPTVTNIDPGNGATDVARTKAIDIIFSRAMDMPSLAASQFSVVGSSKGVYTVTAASIDSQTVRLSHAVDFDSLETITVTVKSEANGGLKDTSATPVGLASDYVITFTAQYTRTAKTVMISTTASTIPADGTSSLTVEAIVQDANVYPVQGATVTFTTGSGKFSNNTQAITATTDAGGKATATLTASTVLQENVTVTAYTCSDLYGTASADCPDAFGKVSAGTTVNFKPGPPSSITLSASPSSIPADGISTSTITATIKDSGGNLVKDGLYVTFQIKDPTDTSLTTAYGVFPNGSYASNPVATSGGSATVVLTAGNTSGVPNIHAIIGALDVSGTPLTVSTSLVAPPTNIAAVSRSRQATISWTPSASPNVLGYNVYRSTTSGSGYVMLNDEPVTTATYTDSDLANDSKYYYVVTTVNTSGSVSSYSSEVPAVPTWDLAWSRSSSNPVFDVGASGSWDDRKVAKAAVVQVAANDYRMWYVGSSNSDPRGRVGYATSTDGITWSKSGSNPVLGFGASGEWDDEGIVDCSVILDGATYKMWYAATGDGAVYRIGYATSPDGITWTKSGSNPVLSPTGSAWDSLMVRRPAVIKDGATYKMWYEGYNGSTYKIGYATSNDGVTWTKSASNPVLSASGGGWDSTYVSGPSVIKDSADNIFKMWYFGTNGTTVGLGYAVSADGVTWNKHASSPVLTLGTLGAFDDSNISAPAALYDGTINFKMWYTGGDGYNQRVGYTSAVQDSQAPTVSSVFPASGATGVEKNANITITFSEDMDESTINASNVTVSGATSGTVGGLITYNSATRTATFNPDADFQSLEVVTVRVRAYVRDLAGNTLDGDGDGTAEGSPTDDRTWTFTVKDTLPPSAPTGLTATAGSSQVALSWTAPSTNSDGSALTDLQGYNVYRSETSGSGYTKITTSVLTSTSYTDTTVTNGTTYYYIVKAVDTSANESAASSEASATPASNPGPAAPTGLTATVAGSTSINLAWTANTESNLQGYKVYRSTTSGSGYTLVMTLGKVTSYQATGLTSGTTYYFVITAVNTSGYESAYSSETSARPGLTGDVDGVLVGGKLTVDGNDLIALAASFGYSEGEIGYNQYADLNGDGIVDGKDLGILGRNFGRTS